MEAYLVGLFIGMFSMGAFCVLFLRSLIKGGYATFEATPKLMELVKKKKTT